MGGCRVRSRPRASLRHRSPLRMSLELRIPSCAKSTRQPPSPRNCPLNASSPAPSCPFRSRDAKKHGPASALRVGTAAGSVLHRPLVTCRVVGAVDEASTSARPTHGPTKGTSGTHGGTEWPRWGRILGSHWTRRRSSRTSPVDHVRSVGRRTRSRPQMMAPCQAQPNVSCSVRGPSSVKPGNLQTLRVASWNSRRTQGGRPSRP